MRNELEQIERIEQYLSKEMNPQELQIFEEELKTNISLQEKVHQQKIVLKGIRKKAFKEVAKSSFKKYKLIKKLWWGGIGLGILAVIISAALILSKKEEKKEPQTIPTKAISTIDSTMVDTVSLAPSTMPTMDSAMTKKPKIKKKKAKKDTVLKPTLTNTVKQNSLMLEKETSNDIEIKN